MNPNCMHFIKRSSLTSSDSRSIDDSSDSEMTKNRATIRKAKEYANLIAETEKARETANLIRKNMLETKDFIFTSGTNQCVTQRGSCDLDLAKGFYKIHKTQITVIACSHNGKF